VKAWLEQHPRWTFHFTPTLGSWLDAVADFFSVLTRKRIRRGSFHSIVNLQAAVYRFLTKHKFEPKPFIWQVSAVATLAEFDRLPELSLLVRAFESHRAGVPARSASRYGRHPIADLGIWNERGWKALGRVIALQIVGEARTRRRLR